MNRHDAGLVILALDTAIVEASKAVAQTAPDAPEYKGYVFALSEFNRIRNEIEETWPV